MTSSDFTLDFPKRYVIVNIVAKLLYGMHKARKKDLSG